MMGDIIPNSKENETLLGLDLKTVPEAKWSGAVVMTVARTVCPRCIICYLEYQPYFMKESPELEGVNVLSLCCWSTAG